MEPRFGHDFSQVRVHTNAKVAESARAVNALAYTVGRDVVFGVGQYAPTTSAGQRLLAHELTHVVQQQGFSTQGQLLQKQGEMVPTPTQPPVGLDLGLPEPNCSTHVADIFELHGTITSSNPKCSVATIKDLRKKNSLIETYRADYRLEGKDPCPGFPGVPDLDTWLDNQWRIVEIERSRVTFINQCGDEEYLGIVPGAVPPPITETKVLENPESIDPKADPQEEFGPEQAYKEVLEINGYKGDAIQYEDGTVQLFPEGSTGSITLRPRPNSTRQYDVYDQDGKKEERTVYLDPNEIFNETDETNETEETVE